MGLIYVMKIFGGSKIKILGLRNCDISKHMTKIILNVFFKDPWEYDKV